MDDIGYYLSEIEAIYSEVSENDYLTDENDAADLMYEMAGISFEADTLISYFKQATIYYIANVKQMQCMLSSFLLRESRPDSFQGGLYFKRGTRGKGRISSIEVVY